MTVVVVDDHPVFAESLAAALGRRADIAVAGTATTIDAAVQLIATLQPNVVLLDYHVGEAVATSAIPRIHASSPTSRVVILSASDIGSIAIGCIRAGAVGLVGKEQTISDVVEVVLAVDAGYVRVPVESLSAAISPAPDDPSALSQREIQVLELLAAGLRNREIALTLHLSVNTVRNHVASILHKLGATGRGHAVAIARRRYLITDQ